MNALRFIEKPQNREIKISLPDYFNDDLVEVIILSLDKKESETSRLNIAQTYLDQSQKSSFDTGKFDPHEQ
ncbi:hypothetical protein [Dyadobacter pollutisoli]|jgi:hypothetical protein|uniref:Uncharacterized protein n=1 Tax=Dyadobacter pollutisoli TaxID=2910158 RepID=A0A9E8SK79_9BACT|nr:hypothetical protein [Dyadobacter pollutisoli]WAC10919.1 hypothetical protein ON006_24625 [Dyadobacter pollutisoli]